MVHALKGIWRILNDRGVLVDLRPLPGHCPIELVSAEVVVQAGEVDATGMVDDDDASDRAIRTTVSQGHFVQRQETHFDFDLYWGSVKEMASFLESSTRMKHIRPSCADLEKTHGALLAEGHEDVRIRCRRKTLLAVYEKADVLIC